MFFRFNFIFLVVAALFWGVFFFARAENPFASITFPIPELGNCGSLDACKTYCDDLAHVDACAAYGKAHGLIKSDDAEKIKHLPKTGPGGCASEDACKAYCADSSHIDECVLFAEKNGLISHDDASRMKQFAAGGGPGGCKGGEECKNYCNDPAHVDECVSFAEKNGFISSHEAEQVRASVNKIGPGGCKGGEECQQYCNDPAHAEECIAFGEENGFISHEDALRAKKFIGKTGPGGCQGQACREYCGDPAHQNECLKFAEENGLIGHDEVERAKKFMDASREGGPGGCHGEQCREYCGVPEHHNECLQFAKDHGLITHEEEQSFDADKKINDAVNKNGGPGGCRSDESCREYCSNPAHTEECLAFAAAHGGISREQAQQMLNNFLQQEKKFAGPQLQENFSGPGGCQGPQACLQYCSDPSHRDECAKFFGEYKGGPQTGAGPGGCLNPDDCRKYCTDPAHQTECVRFGNPGIDRKCPRGTYWDYAVSDCTPQQECGSGMCWDNATKTCVPGAEPCGRGIPSYGPGAGAYPTYPNQPPVNFSGPGGCKGYEECKAYCTDPAHQTECQTFRPAPGMMPGSEMMPGNMPPMPSSGNTPPPPPAGATSYPCNSYDSCKAYCSDASHQQEDVCVKFLQYQQPQSRSDYFWGGFASLGKAAFDLFR